MRAQILDPGALRAITPGALIAYAQAEGWRRTEGYGKHSDVYEASELPELVIPRTERLADYARVVSELIAIFAETSERDELAVYRDLSGADRDVIRIHARGAEEDGSVSIDAGVGLVGQARDMLLAAACAATNPQPLYRAGANKEASDYMRRVRLGQTEHGSFVVTLLAPVPPLLQRPRDPAWVDFDDETYDVTLLAPVPPLLQRPRDPAWMDFDDEPYDRRVTRRLMDGLAACRSALEQANTGTGMEAFERAVKVGVSANLCEAVAQLIEYSDGLDVGLTWARTRPGPEIQRKASFSVNDAETLREAARTFRARRSRHDVELFGTVHQLKRDQDEVDGLVILKALVDDKIQSVRAVLDQASYSLAVQAHGRQAPVVVRGDLERVGQRWQISGAELVTIGSEDDNEAA